MAQDILYLSRADVEAVNLPMADIVRAVEDVLVEKGNGRVEMPPKPGIHPQPDCFIHAMPAYVASMRSAGIKWVSGYPANIPKGLPYISGLLILNDPETGIPIGVMDCTWITAKRTGAASAVAARYLARPDSRQVAILACGVQGRSNIEALKVVFPAISQVKAYDVRREVAAVYAREMSEQLKVHVEAVRDPESAVRGADIVVTSGPILLHPDPVLELAWLKEGAFLSPVDFDSYVKPDVFRAAARLYTDDMAQFEHYRKIGYFSQTPQPQGDLGELVCGRKPGRQSPLELTVSVNLGLAIEDMATAIRIHAIAAERGIGKRLPL